MSLLLFFVIAGCVGISNAVSCYSCSERNFFFNSSSGLFTRIRVNGTDCLSPGSSSSLVETECDGTCMTRLLYSSSFLVSSRFIRSCEEDNYAAASLCDNCRSPSDCTLCCDSDRCNDASLADIIQDNRIGQSCYSCRHSEIPGEGSFNPGCGLDFNPERAMDVSYSFCEGLCYSAVTFINGVEDVQRGCRSDGDGCDNINHPYREDKSTWIGGSFNYDMRCCLGSFCNGAQSVGGNAAGSILLTMFASYIVSSVMIP